MYHNRVELYNQARTKFPDRDIRQEYNKSDAIQRYYIAIVELKKTCKDLGVAVKIDLPVFLKEIHSCWEN